MNAPAMTAESDLDLAGLAAAGRLARAARLYGVVLDGEGHPGGRRFLAELPEGAAVFQLGAPGVRFVLVDRAATDQPLLSAVPLDAAAIDAWYSALLASPGLAHSDAQAAPMVPGERRACTAGQSLTARSIVWLDADAPALRYPEIAGMPASPAMSRLVMADQIGALVTDDTEVRAFATATLLDQEGPQMLGKLSADLALRLAAALIHGDARRQHRWQQIDEVDEARAGRALQRLRDIAAFRRPALQPVMRPGQDRLPGVLALLAAAQGFTLQRPTLDNARSPLLERLKAYAISSGFRYREIALGGLWWKQEAPPFMAIDAASGAPVVLLARLRRWHTVDPETLAERPVDAALAATLRPTGYMLYPGTSGASRPSAFAATSGACW
jgi:hypothetical protein